MKSSLVSLLKWKSKSKINTKVKDIQNNTTIFIIDIIILFYIHKLKHNTTFLFKYDLFINSLISSSSVTWAIRQRATNSS